MRRPNRSLSLAVSLVAGLAWAPPSFSAEETVPVPNLAGRWTFDPEKSDDVRQKMREARGGREPGSDEGGPRRGGPGGGGGMGGGRGGGAMGGGRGGGMGGGRGMGGERPGGPGGGEGREAMRALFEAAPELLITPTTNELVILEKDGRLRTLHPDGKTYKSEGGASETRTRWQGGGLVVESKMPSGTRVLETFTLVSVPKEAERSGTDSKTADPALAEPSNPDKKMLKVTIRLDGGPRPPVEFKRVYQLEGAAQ